LIKLNYYGFPCIIPVSVQEKSKIKALEEKMSNRKATFVAAAIIASLVIFGCLGSNEIQEEVAKPTNTPIPGWVKFEGKGIELWLPDSYVGGDISENMDLILSRVRDLGADFEQIAQMIEQNPDMYALWATDSEIGPSGFLTNVGVTSEQILTTVSVDTYLDAAEAQFPAEFQIVSREKVSLGEYEAGRVEVEFEYFGIFIKELLYTVKDGTTMWVITYATGLDEFEDRLPEFEQSANSFQTK
jgi:outer membrane murein-binding lipoprotein Lpp